jgi:hypothetical protein
MENKHATYKKSSQKQQDLAQKVFNHYKDPKSVLTEENLNEFGEKTSDALLESLKVETQTMNVFSFEKGFFTFDWKPGREELTIHSFYRSKDSTADILEIWKDFVDFKKSIGVKKILGFAINKKLRDLYESKYGFTILDYNKSEKRYYMELEI